MIFPADLLAQVRLYLADETVWPDDTIYGYMVDAVRFYSVEFPRRSYRTLDLTTGTQAYDLWGDLREVLKVEYPAGESPPEYLDRVPLGSPALGNGEDVYAVTGAVFASLDVNTEIVFGPTVATGEDAVIHYLGLHRIDLSKLTDAEITVPEEHLEALHALIDFRAHWQLESAEAVDIGTSSIELSQLGENARRAWNRYKEITARLQELHVVSAPAGMAWLGRDRIY